MPLEAQPGNKMEQLDKWINDFATQIFTAFEKDCDEAEKRAKDFMAESKKRLAKARAGNFEDYNFAKPKKTSKRTTVRDVSPAEPTEPAGEVEFQVPIGRPKRTASKLAETLVSKQINMKLGSKLRRPDDSRSTLESIVKEEKVDTLYEKHELSTAGSTDVGSSSTTSPSVVPHETDQLDAAADLKIKKEKLSMAREEMRKESNEIDLPVKTKREPRTKKGKRKAKKQSVEEDDKPTEKSIEDDEVVAVETNIPVIDLDEDDVSEKPSVDDIKLITPCTVNLTKIDSIPAIRTTNSSQTTSITRDTYAVVDLSKPDVDRGDATFVVDKSHKKNDEAIDDLLTDDEDPVIDAPVTPPASKLKKPTSVKKRVEAFEKLATAKKDIPAIVARVTRTKTKAAAAAAAAAAVSATPSPDDNPLMENKNIASKYVTPLHNNTRKLLLKSVSKENVLTVPKTIGSKTRFTPGPEDSALRKREAQMQAKIEQTKRKNEQRALKAQQLREESEKLRQQALEREEREKREKERLKSAEREEKLRQEQLRKKEAAALKQLELEERRKKDEEMRMAKILEQERNDQRKREEAEENERYRQRRAAEDREQQETRKRKDLLDLRSKAEMERKLKRIEKIATSQTKEMVTSSNYTALSAIDEQFSKDDGDDTCVLNKMNIPSWMQPIEKNQTLATMSLIPSEVFARFFTTEPYTIDLTKIFKQVHKRDQMRNESAIWDSPPPPRYSVLPKNNESFADSFTKRD